MSKVKVKAITRWQKFLAAIAGDAVAPNPVTDREKLMYNIAEKVNEGGGLPDYSGASDGDVLGISSGEPGWVTPSGGGGVLVVHESEVEIGGEPKYVLDKTYAEIASADYAVCRSVTENRTVMNPLGGYMVSENIYTVVFGTTDDNVRFYVASSADGQLVEQLNM